MQKILVIGAGRSSSTLIKYLLDNADKQNWIIRVGDSDLLLAQERVDNNPKGEAFIFDALNPDDRIKEISKVDLVISMLPAIFHIDVIKDCIKLKKHILTPSYQSKEMFDLDAEVKAAGILSLNEIGLDPGIDHMSAKKVLDEIVKKGGEMTGFESFTGGLIAPESDDNPWNYKFTWNPRNVVLAGQGGTAKFLQEHKYKYIPYSKLFRRTEIIEIEGYGKFEGYANRDSLSYRSIYDLDDIPTIFRGTLRKLGFCRAWNIFVQLGVTDDSYIIEGSENMTYRDFINSFLPYSTHDSVELKFRHLLNIEQDDYIWEKLVWLGIFENNKINIKNATPAQILQKILEEKWTLKTNDKDMIVMWHKFNYKLNGINKEIRSYMVYIGKDQIYTAMSDTVGLPVGICAKLILNKKINLTGVHLPTYKDIYIPVLKELEDYGINFIEKEVDPVLYV
jgi:saccharopine dehydrogenase-like NADP-dependent oxidoreductase